MPPGPVGRAPRARASGTVDQTRWCRDLVGVVEAGDRAVRAQGEVLHADAGADGGAGVGGGVGQPLGDLAEAAPRVQEGAPLGPAPADQAADDGARPGRADPPAGELAGQVARIDAPDLADVGPVELVGDGRTEPGPDDLGEGVAPRATASRGEGGIARRPQRRTAAACGPPGRWPAAGRPPSARGAGCARCGAGPGGRRRATSAGRRAGAASWTGGGGGCRGRPAGRPPRGWPPCPRPVRSARPR